jgi:hypothetical protein
LESVLTGLLSVDDPVEIITVPLKSFDDVATGNSWAEVQNTIAVSTGEIALGYREDVDGVGQVVLNPLKDARVPLSAELIVLSQASLG